MAPKALNIHEAVLHVADVASLRLQIRFLSCSTMGRLTCVQEGAVTRTALTTRQPSPDTRESFDTPFPSKRIKEEKGLSKHLRKDFGVNTSMDHEFLRKEIEARFKYARLA